MIYQNDADAAILCAVGINFARPGRDGAGSSFYPSRVSHYKRAGERVKRAQRDSIG